MNHLKLALLTVGILILLSWSALRAQQQETPSCAGRFQLLQGEYLSIVNHGTIPQKSIFRIDTATGRAWRYVEGIGGDGKLISQWSLLSESK